MGLELIDNKPIYSKPRRFSPKLSAFVETEVNRQLKLGVIRKSKSPYACRVTLAPKGDSYRMCVNYRPVNVKVKRDRYPLRNIEDILSGVNLASVFSTLDGLSGF